jgi:hypothetical protein
MTDFITRRQTALRRERELYAEWLAEEELEAKVAQAHFEFKDRLERERAQRQKYEAAMAEKCRGGAG